MIPPVLRWNRIEKYSGKNVTSSIMIHVDNLANKTNTLPSKTAQPAACLSEQFKLSTCMNTVWANSGDMRGSKCGGGGGGQGARTLDLKGNKNIWCLSNTGPDPWKNHKATLYQASIHLWVIIDPPAKRHLNGVSLADRWWPAYSGILILPPLIQKNPKTTQSWTPSDKTSWIRALGTGTKPIQDDIDINRLKALFVHGVLVWLAQYTFALTLITPIFVW